MHAKLKELGLINLKNHNKELRPHKNLKAIVDNAPQVDSLEKKLYRILKHICEDLQICNPHVKTPSPSLLKHLLNNCFANANQVKMEQEKICPPDYKLHLPHLVIYSLKYLDSKLVHTNRVIPLYEMDGKTPLFPNSEAFTPKDTIVFLRSANTIFEKNFNSFE